jgi:hypothetical protein
MLTKSKNNFFVSHVRVSFQIFKTLEILVDSHQSFLRGSIKRIVQIPSESREVTQQCNAQLMVTYFGGTV